MYDWDSKEAICRRLYVDENKSLDEVLAILKDDGFTPSKRAFQMQFRRWRFPLKYQPLSDDEDLHARIKELWDSNTRQKDMLSILETEGYTVKERDLMRIRAKNGWLLRQSNGSKSESTTKKRKTQVSDEEQSDYEDEVRRELQESLATEQEDQSPARKIRGPRATQTLKLSAAETPEQALQRQQRIAELEAVSAQKWETGKRRRRTKGYAGMGPDPVGPPRFPSETTIDESKVVLRIVDNKLYRRLRDEFQAICEEGGIKKKTDVGPERWQAAKEQLITQSPHLQEVFYGSEAAVESLERKQLCLDVICLDVTKRMRDFGKKMTLLEARVLLKLNPEQTRRVRSIFYAMLKKDNFISKVMAGPTRWNQLKARWIADTDLLQDFFADGDPDGTKDKALEILAKDIVKRLRDDLTRVEGKSKATTGPSGGPGPAPPRYSNGKPNQRSTASSTAELTAAMALAATAGDGLDTLAAATDLQIDPTLLLAAEHIHDQAASSTSSHRSSSNMEHMPSVFTYPLLAGTPSSNNNASISKSKSSKQFAASSMPVFLHLMRSSGAMSLPKPQWWMDVLHIFTFSELEQRVREKHPALAVLQVRGETDSNKTTIHDNASLRTYLNSVEVGQARLAFVVESA